MLCIGRTFLSHNHFLTFGDPRYGKNIFMSKTGETPEAELVLGVPRWHVHMHRGNSALISPSKKTIAWEIIHSMTQQCEEQKKSRLLQACFKREKNPAPCYSPILYRIVPSPLRPLTSVFGMGTGVSTSLWIPGKEKKKERMVKSLIRVIVRNYSSIVFLQIVPCGTTWRKR